MESLCVLCLIINRGADFQRTAENSAVWFGTDSVYLVVCSVVILIVDINFYKDNHFIELTLGPIQAVS